MNGDLAELVNAAETGGVGNAEEILKDEATQHSSQAAPADADATADKLGPARAFCRQR